MANTSNKTTRRPLRKLRRLSKMKKSTTKTKTHLRSQPKHVTLPSKPKHVTVSIKPPTKTKTRVPSAPEIHPDDFDLKSYLQERQKTKDVLDDDGDSKLAENAMNHTNAHEARRDVILDDFLSCLKEKGTWGRMLELVVDDDDLSSHPRLFRVLRCEGQVKATRAQLHLLNEMLVD